MPQIVIKNLSGGIITDFASNNKAVEGREGQYTKTSGIDLYRPNFQGHISPAQVFSSGGITDATPNINSLPLAQTVDITQNPPYVFFMLSGLSGTAPRVVRVLNDAYDSHQVISAHGGHNFTTIPTAGTGTWGEDVALYPVGSTNYIFYSWNDSSDGDVGRATLAGIYDDDFMSTVAASGAALTTNVPHRLVEGPDKILYITNGRYVASFDGATGANGTFNATAYDLGAGWIATDLRVEKNYLVISAVRTSSFNYYTFFGKSKVCYWIPGEAGLGIVYDIQDSFVSAIYKYQDTMIAFTTGKDKTTKLIPIGTDKPLVQFRSTIYGLPPKPNSIDVYNGNLVWIPGDAFGDYIMQLNPQGGLHLPYIINDGTNDSSQTSGGLLKNYQSNNLYVGGVFSGVYKVRYLDGLGGYASTKDLRTRLFRIPYKSVINKVKVYISQMESGSSATFSLFRNYVASSISTVGTDFLAGATPSQTISYTSNGSLSEYEIPCAIHSTSAFYMNIRVSGQISIAEIVVEYETLR